jgi:hypothetical protein
MVATMPTSSPSSGVVGSVEPRIWTPPLRELTPQTSYGFDVIDFAEYIGRPLDLWQKWLVVHAGELQEDGITPRFRQVLVLVARQNGKTELLVILSLYWQFVERVRLILGTSTNLDYARESWDKAVALAEGTETLMREIHPKSGVRRANGEQTLTIATGGRYKIAASNARGGRSLTVDRLIMDELREHHDWSAYNAAMPATSAVKDAQAYLITNQGDDKSVVLASLRKQALDKTDPRLGLFEWSAPDGAKATDVEALAMANPNLGHRISLDSLMGDALRAEAAGGEQLAGFLTEHQCRYVPMLSPAIDPTDWMACLDLGDLTAVRDRVTLCMDVSPDMQHATLYAAALLDDERVRVEPIAAWSGAGCTDQLRRELLSIVERVKPKRLGWFPAGPAASLAADMSEERGWMPEGVEVEEIRGEVTAVCMGFSEQVSAKRIAHSGDPLLDAHVAGAEKLMHGDGWRFSRRGSGHVDAAYAAAGAVHLARTIKPETKVDFFWVNE